MSSLAIDTSRLPDLRATMARRQIETWLGRQGLSYDELTAHTREPEALEARIAVARFLRSEGWSLPAIGRFLRRDHTSVLHLLRKYGGTE